MDEPLKMTNTCTTDSECGSGGTCVEQACIASQGKLDDLLLEVVPDAANIATAPDFEGVAAQSGLSFLLTQSALARGDRARLIRIAGVRPFVGQVTIPAALATSAGCPAVGKDPVTTAAHVTFTRSAEFDGLPVPGMTPLVTQVDASGDNLTFSASLVPGLYEVYVQLGCAMVDKVPPMLMTDVEVGSTVDAASQAPPARIAVPEPLTLQGQVKAGALSLAGWKVSLIEPKAGRRISSVATLGSDSQTNFMLSYQPVNDPASRGLPPGPHAKAASPLIQIAPPDNVKAPTVYWDLAAANLQATNKMALDMSGVPSQANLVEVAGRLFGANEASGVAGTIWFFSTSLVGSSGLRASFSPYVMTDEDGHYSTRLFPGTYRIAAVPGPSETSTDGAGSAHDPTQSDGWAITEQSDFVVATGTPQVHDIELRPKVTLSGRVTLAGTGRAAVGATIVAEAPTRETTVWDGSLLARTAVLPRSSRVSVPESGAFALVVDQSTFDLTARPPEGSGFAWWVLPSLSVASQDGMVLEPTLPLPVPFEGQIQAIAFEDQPGAKLDGTLFANALVRAYAKTPRGESVSQVGSARTDGQGRFRLPLPSDFAY